MKGIFFPFLFSCLSEATAIPDRAKQNEQDVYDYCDSQLKLCINPSEHVMCKYPVPGLSSRCLHAVDQPLTPMEKEKILYFHNKCRSSVAAGLKKLPSSSNMRQMTWDNELESLAKRWAEQCMTNDTIYDECRNTKRFQVSQNVGTRLAYGTIIDKQAPFLVNEWCEQTEDFKPDFVDNYTPDEDISSRHFSNMLLADTNSVGCARVVFQEDNSPHIWTIERLVCNYGPSEKGKQLYKKGAPCSECPVGTSCSLVFSGLCTPPGTNKIWNKFSFANKSNKTLNVLVPMQMVEPNDIVRERCQCGDVYVSFGIVNEPPSFFLIFLCFLFGRRFFFW